MRRSPLITLAFAFAVTVIACSSASKSGSPRAQATETPPATQDPGAVGDRPDLQSSTPRPERPEHQQTVEARPEAGAAPSTPVQLQVDGASCVAASDCQSGVCEGQGCTPDKPGACAPRKRACTRDLRPYCGCDGKTFRTSGSCPGQRYSARAECTP